MNEAIVSTASSEIKITIEHPSLFRTYYDRKMRFVLVLTRKLERLRDFAESLYHERRRAFNSATSGEGEK